MKTLLVGAVAAVVLSATAVSAQQDATRNEFQLIIGDRSYDVIPGSPLTIVTPGGETVDVLLIRRDVIRFEKHGISFDYPGAMSVSSDVVDGTAMIYVESVTSPFVILHVYANGTPADVIDSLYDAMRDEIAALDATFLAESGRSVSRRIGGAVLDGKRLSYQFGDERMVTDVFAFEHEGAVVAAVFQRKTDESDVAEEYFAVISGSLR